MRCFLQQASWSRLEQEWGKSLLWVMSEPYVCGLLSCMFQDLMKISLSESKEISRLMYNFQIFPQYICCRKKVCLEFKAEADFRGLPRTNGFPVLSVVVFLLPTPFSSRLSPAVSSLLSPAPSSLSLVAVPHPEDVFK